MIQPRARRPVLREKIIVPAFAVGRTQELLYVLHDLLQAGRLPTIPIFIDSPLAIDVTDVFRMHPECFDTETRAFLDEHGDLFSGPWRARAARTASRDPDGARAPCPCARRGE